MTFSKSVRRRGPRAQGLTWSALLLGLTLMLGVTASGCCSDSLTLREPLPANRVTRPTRQEVEAMTRLDFIAELVAAYDYIESLERDGLWLQNDR